MQFTCFHVLPGSAETQVIYGGIVKRISITYLSVAFLPKISKSFHMYKKVRFSRATRTEQGVSGRCLCFPYME